MREKMRLALTDISIRKIPNRERGNKMYWDTVVPGFGVRVTKLSKAYFIIYGDKRRSKTLGKYPAMSLKQARAAAIQLQADIASDTSLVGLQSLSKARNSYLKECEAKNAKKTCDQYRLYLEKVDKKQLTDVRRQDVDILSPHAVMAWKVFFNWCLRNELVERNPFAHTSARPRC